MARFTVELAAVADQQNLLLALHKAARDKSARPDVQLFRARLEPSINRLAMDILDGRLPYGRFREFVIHDPKSRRISAACFEDRVFHHALMNHIGPPLERSMSPHSYACREGRGVHRAARQVQRNLQRFAWYGKIDIAGYFPSISHSILLAILQRRFYGRELDQQFVRIVRCHQFTPGFGLPIGSLTSQVFANYYLDELDRQLAALPAVRAVVRYMDDLIWWCDSREATQESFGWMGEWLAQQRDLQLKPGTQIQQSRRGVSWCGYRITRGALRLSRRRKRRFQQRRMFWEEQFLQGKISAAQLQMAASAVQSITSGTDSLGWRQENLRRHPCIQA